MYISELENSKNHQHLSLFSLKLNRNTMFSSKNTVPIKYLNIKLMFTILITLFLTCSPAKAEPPKTIVVIPKSTLLHFWKIVCTGAAAATNDRDVKLIWRGPRVENKVDAQKHLMNFYIDKKVDAIVIAPTHRSKLNTSIEKAVQAGIKVVVIDSIATTNAKHSFVGTDNYKAGKLGAKILLERTTQKGPLLLMGNVPQSSSISAREQGFIDEVNNIAPGRTIVKINLNEGTRREAQLVAEDILQCSKKLSGIFAVNEVSSEGVLHALRKKTSIDIPFVGIDYSHRLIEGIKDGIVDALITQKPYAIGYFGVRTAIDLLNGIKTPKVMESPVKIITKENIQFAKTLRCLKEFTVEEKKECPMCFN